MVNIDNGVGAGQAAVLIANRDASLRAATWPDSPGKETPIASE